MLKVADSCLTICTKTPVLVISVISSEIQPQQRYLCSCVHRCFWKFHPCVCLSSAALRVPPVVLPSEQQHFSTRCHHHSCCLFL